MKRSCISIFVLIVLLTTDGFSQIYESMPCGCCVNTELKDLLKGKKLAKIYLHECGVGGAHTLSSSFLKPGGVAPKDPTKDPNYKPAYPDDAIGEAEEFAMNFDKWSCTYAASMLKDGDVKTAWVEGVAGYGIGELVIAPHLNASKKVELFTGFGKSEALFKANSRPKTIKVHVLKIEYNGNSAQCGTWYENVELLKTQTVALQDVNKFQLISVPAFKRETYMRDSMEYDYVYWVMLEIVDVYQGLKYQDTCISEIRNIE